MTAWGWALLAALAWGFAPILEKTGLSSVKPMVGLFYRCFGVILGTIFVGLFLVKPSDLKSVDMRSLIFLVLGGFLASIIGQMCFYNSLKLGEVSRMVPISASYPLIAFLLGVFILGESITPLKFCGLFLVMGGIWLIRS